MRTLQYVGVAFLAFLISAGTTALGAAPRQGVSLAPLCPPSFVVRLACASFNYGGIKFDYYACSGAAGGKVVHLQYAYCNAANPGKLDCVYDQGTGLWGSTQSCGVPPPPPPPPKCLPGYTGTPPHCYPRGRCPLGSNGTFPNCSPSRCPVGFLGTPPNCKPLVRKILLCPPGYTGTPPNCIKVIIR